AAARGVEPFDGGGVRDTIVASYRRLLERKRVVYRRASVDDPGRRVKRAVDVILSGAGLAVLAPAIATIAIAIRVQDGRPVLFRQARTGLNGRTFRLVKFRTMREDDTPGGATSSDDARVTPLGRILRRYRLDE